MMMLTMLTQENLSIGTLLYTIQIRRLSCLKLFCKVCFKSWRNVKKKFHQQTYKQLPTDYTWMLTGVYQKVKMFSPISKGILEIDPLLKVEPNGHDFI